jgi:hypothetical protein
MVGGEDYGSDEEDQTPARDGVGGNGDDPNKGNGNRGNGEEEEDEKEEDDEEEEEENLTTPPAPFADQFNEDQRGALLELYTRNHYEVTDIPDEFTRDNLKPIIDFLRAAGLNDEAAIVEAAYPEDEVPVIAEQTVVPVEEEEENQQPVAEEEVVADQQPPPAIQVTRQSSQVPLGQARTPGGGGGGGGDGDPGNNGDWWDFFKKGFRGGLGGTWGIASWVYSSFGLSGVGIGAVGTMLKYLTGTDPVEEVLKQTLGDWAAMMYGDWYLRLFVTVGVAAGKASERAPSGWMKTLADVVYKGSGVGVVVRATYLVASTLSAEVLAPITSALNTVTSLARLYGGDGGVVLALLAGPVVAGLGVAALNWIMFGGSSGAKEFLNEYVVNVGGRVFNLNNFKSVKSVYEENAKSYLSDVVQTIHQTGAEIQREIRMARSVFLAEYAQQRQHKIVSTMEASANTLGVRMMELGAEVRKKPRRLLNDSVSLAHSDKCPDFLSTDVQYPEDNETFYCHYSSDTKQGLLKTFKYARKREIQAVCCEKHYHEILEMREFSVTSMFWNRVNKFKYELTIVNGF